MVIQYEEEITEPIHSYMSSKRVGGNCISYKYQYELYILGEPYDSHL